MRLWFALVLFVGAQAHAQTDGQIRYVFKGARPALEDAKKITFGLDAEQAAQIRRLTGDEIRLDEYYFVDRPQGTRQILDNTSFSGVILPNVPPPVLLTPDPALVDQWWIEKLKVKQAWTLASGLGVTIADCDAGFYHDEGDLFANMLMDYRQDFGNPANPLVVNDGGFTTHGTAVSAIMASIVNGMGTNGISYNSKIVPLQNFNYDATDTIDKEEATAKCILYAITVPNVNIIVLENQMATGSSEAFAGTRDAVRLALQAGIIVVGAAGNNSVPLAEETLDDTGSIIVGALNQDESAASFSNYGDRATVGAFGENLHTLYGPNGYFGYFGGTSGATPQVAATVALMKEVNPLLTPAQARQILQETRLLTQANKKVGGLLDAFAAVTKAKESAADASAWTAAWLFRQELTAILLQ